MRTKKIFLVLALLIFGSMFFVNSKVALARAGECSVTHYNCSYGSSEGGTVWSGLYIWDCVGDAPDGDDLTTSGTVSCSETMPIDGKCSTSIYQCTTDSNGMPYAINQSETTTQYTWQCPGLYNGTTASCTSNKPAVCPEPIYSTVEVACPLNNLGQTSISGSVTRAIFKSGTDASPACKYPSAPYTDANSFYVSDNCVYTPPSQLSYTVTAVTGTGGSIEPSLQYVISGNKASFSVIPHQGYAVNDTYGCGGTLSGSTYTTGAIREDCVIGISFIKVLFPSCTINIFTATPSSFSTIPTTVVVAWNASNCYYLTLDGVSVAAQGNKTVSLSEWTTFHLTGSSYTNYWPFGPLYLPCWDILEPACYKIVSSAYLVAASTVNITKTANCPAGTTYTASTGNSGTVPGSFSFYTTDAGQSVSVSGAATGYTVTADPSSRMFYPGTVASFDLDCKSPPPENKCLDGTSPSIPGDTTSCTCLQGNTAVCPVNGACSSPLANNGCARVTLQDITDTATEYKWNCLGSNNGTTAPCSLAIPSGPIDAVCNVGSCSASCGGGTQTTTCTLPSNGGLTCAQIGCTPSTTSCNTQACVVNTPDLTAGNATPATAVPGTAVTFSSTISNIGTASTGSSFNNFFQIATAASGGGTITDLASSVMPTLASGGNSVTTKSYTFASAGTYSVRACADKTSAAGGGVITEPNEGNNCGVWANVTVSTTSTCTAPVITFEVTPPSGPAGTIEPKLTWTASSCE